MPFLFCRPGQQQSSITSPLLCPGLVFSPQVTLHFCLLYSILEFCFDDTEWLPEEGMASCFCQQSCNIMRVNTLSLCDHSDGTCRVELMQGCMGFVQPLRQLELILSSAFSPPSLFHGQRSPLADQQNVAKLGERKERLEHSLSQRIIHILAEAS